MWYPESQGMEVSLKLNMRISMVAEPRFSLFRIAPSLSHTALLCSLALPQHHIGEDHKYERLYSGRVPSELLVDSILNCPMELEKETMNGYSI